MSSVDELKGLAEARSKSWWLLSRFYLERPEPPFLADLRRAMDGAAGAEGAGAEDLAIIRGCMNEGDAALSARLLPEFTRLFRGIKKHYGPPPPFESIHRGDSLTGDVSRAVLLQYEAAGFGEIVPGIGPQDHLGAELRFLSLLCYREMEAWEGGDEPAAMERIARQRAFLDGHLLAWLPGYAALIARESREPFYAAAARLTLARAEQERSLLDDLESDLQAA